MSGLKVLANILRALVAILLKSDTEQYDGCNGTDGLLMSRRRNMGV